MKKIISGVQTISIILLLSLVFWSFSTKDSDGTTGYHKKIYCQLYVHIKYNVSTLKYDHGLEVHHGNYLSYPNKSTESQKVASFSFYVDALNYLGARGWRIVLTNRHVIDGYWDYEDSYVLEKSID